MFSWLSPVFVTCLSGSVLGHVDDHITYLPGLKWTESDTLWRKSDSFCYQFTWLGTNYHARNFHQVAGKNCSEFFTGKNKPLCIDPMVVSETGKKPDIAYLSQNYPKETKMRMTEGQVCVKYTIYSNGIPSLVARYPARIFITDGKMDSGCIVQTDGARSSELCACISVPGSICNASPALTATAATIFAVSVICGLVGGAT